MVRAIKICPAVRVANMPPDSKAIETAILSLAAACGPGKTISPAEAARALSGPQPEQWAPLMGPIRRTAVALAETGRVVIYRKGKEADPHDFRGVYRLGLPRHD